MKRPLARSSGLLVASLFAICFAGTAYAQEQSKGDASMRLEFQFLRNGAFQSQDATFDYWTTDTQVAVLSGSYALDERWTVFATLPYVRKRFNSEVPWGGDPHNPNDPYWVDFVPPDLSFWDDGNYHGGLQDFSVGVSYRIDRGSWTLHPYISYGVPASDYPFFAKAAIGKQLWTIPVGTSISYVPYFSDWHFGGDFAYVFSEQPLGQTVDYWLAHLSAGYWFKANLSVSGFLSMKYGYGLSLLSSKFLNDNASDPPLIPDDLDTEEWWEHDRMVGNRSLNFGLGVDYVLSSEWALSGSAFQSVWTDEANEADFAFTLALTRFFGGE